MDRREGSTGPRPAPNSPPATGIRRSIRPAKRPILKSLVLHFARRQQVAAVYDQRSRHDLPNAVPVELAEFVPFGSDEQGLGILGSIVGSLCILDLRKNGAGPFHRLRIIGSDAGTFSQKVIDQVDRGCEADVVGIGFECQPENAELFSADDPESAAQLFKEVVDPLLVNFLHFPEHRKIDTGAFGEMDERLQILGQTEAAKTQTGGQKTG